jgi:hypothetical protein
LLHFDSLRSFQFRANVYLWSIGWSPLNKLVNTDHQPESPVSGAEKIREASGSWMAFFDG